MRKSAITGLVATRCLDKLSTEDSAEDSLAKIANAQEQARQQLLPETPSQKAFRAVVKDDASKLSEVFNEVPVQEWSTWTNKGKQTLAAMAEQRNGRASACYMLMAKHLGLPLQ